VSGHALPVGLVLPAWKIVYVPVPKAACTSTLWTLAEIQEEARDPSHMPPSAAVTRALLVHEPAFWGHTPRLQDLSSPKLDALRSDGNWLTFTITRHPVNRLWSAWQSKLLMREPRFVRDFGACEWFPRIPRSARDVVEEFRRFVAALAADPELLRADRHWQPQVELLQLERVGFTHVGTTSDHAQTLRVLEGHLTASGWLGELHARRENATLLPADAFAAIDDATRQTIETIYADDIELLGYDAARAPDDRDAVFDPLLAEQLVAGVRAIAARHERITDLLSLGGVGPSEWP
jgi:hypothetical protein